MNTDDSMQPDTAYYRAGQATARGFADGIVPPDAFRDFEVQFLDYTIMRQMYIASPSITHKDVAFLRERLDVLTPEFRAFVLKAAEMICEAGEAE